jgi:prolipoprotein diacylglyceryl transferase
MIAVPQKQFDILLDRLVLYVTFGLILFARIFHVFFYDREYFQTHPAHIFSIWEGGLASHGALVGLILSTWYFYKKKDLFVKYKLVFLQLLDAIALASFPAAACIRIGNFFNQEIVGLPTNSSLGILFSHPLGTYLEPVVRHPVQLYEAMGYTLLGLLFLVKRKQILLKPGLGFGLILVSFFFSAIYSRVY